VRWYEGKGKYKQQVLGVADDVIAAGNLDFAAASKVGREVVAAARRERVALPAPGPTVGDAVRAYIEMRDLRDCKREGRLVKSDANYKMTAYVLSDANFCGRLISSLTEKDLRDWVDGLPSELATTTVRRIINDFRAALNDAVDRNRHVLADLKAVIQAGLKLRVGPTIVEGVRENQILTDDQVREILAAAKEIDEDLWRMLLVLAATGARFAQAKRLRVEHVQLDRGRLIMGASAKGKKSKLVSVALKVGPDVIEALEPIVRGRPPNASLLEHWKLAQGKVGEWERVDREAWKTSSQMQRAWVKICDRCGIEGRVIYSLRHSSIIRAIRAGLPLRLVGALHDTSAHEIETHYSRWIVDGLEELAAKAIVPLV
jgi:integrase